jgi:ribokinase
MPSKRSASAGRVIVVGSTNTDLVVHCASLPKAGETVLGRDLLTFAGGKGANQAVAAARAGARVHFIGAFGDDEFGRARRADLEREGIDCSGCVVKKGVPSGVALIGIGCGERGAKAENLIIVAAGANARLTPADVKRGMPKGLSERDVILCSLEVPLAAVQAALLTGIDVGRQNAPRKILNPAPYPTVGLPGKIYVLIDIITPNETEFEQMSGASVAQLNGDRIGRIGKMDGFTTIVTRGAKGVALAISGTKGRRVFPAPKVKPVDTVGAGDCFNGCLAAQLSMSTSTIDESVRFAVTAAALKVTRAGAQAGMPRRSEILKMR